MLNENDAPKSMEAHYPPRPGKADRDSQNQRLICPGSTALMKNVTLGALARTDVFEMVLRKPQNGEYLPDNTEEGRIVAMTLAVALRQALAGFWVFLLQNWATPCVRSDWKTDNRY
jgi:hypothetical protein